MRFYMSVDETEAETAVERRVIVSTRFDEDGYANHSTLEIEHECPTYWELVEMIVTSLEQHFGYEFDRAKLFGEEE